MYKLNNFLFNIKNKQTNLNDKKFYYYYFPNFDYINYFLYVAKKEDIANINLNYIINYGLSHYTPTNKQLEILFKNIIFFDKIDNEIFDYVYNKVKNDLNINIFKGYSFPLINNYAYKLIFNKDNIVIKSENYKNIKKTSYIYNNNNINNINNIKKNFKSYNIAISEDYINFIKNKKNIYIHFKNFDNEFAFNSIVSEFEFSSYELKLNSKKNIIVPIASENLYSLYYGIDINDNKTKIFIGESDYFDENHEVIANNFDELMNSNDSLLKIYNFMKESTLAIEY